MNEKKSNTEIIVLGGGCFWCLEAIFSKITGVIKVVPGYAGGHKEDPNYEEVSGGRTGYAEVIEIEYNPEVISYEDLLDVFFHVHNPTTLNRQGADIGEQYRSIILYTSQAQKDVTEKIIKKLQETGEFKDPIVTKIKPLIKFYKAEEYHLRYYDKNPQKTYCQIVITPKIVEFNKKYQKLLKN